jgi:plasmid maintenance system antidote protein VapI
MRLGRLFGVSDDYFLKLQTDIDLRKATTWNNELDFRFNRQTVPGTD